MTVMQKGVYNLKNSKDFVEQRRERIMTLLGQHGEIKVSELSATLGFSPLTIRRDLEALEKNGLLQRQHGGAVPAGRVGESAITSLVLRCRHAIAQKAASLLEAGDVIFINSSSTALLAIEYIQASNVTVITNNARAINCKKRDDTNIILLGGEIRFPKGALSGEFAITNLSGVTATKSLLGCSGLTDTEGFTTVALQEVAINRLMLERVTGDRIVLADHQKIGKQYMFISGAPDQFNCLITDQYADPSTLSNLSAKGLQIYQEDV